MPTRCNIISDSTCDLGIEVALNLDVTLVPFTYTEANKPDGGFHGTDDQFQGRSAHEFYEAMRAGATPMTSQPSQLAYEEAFQGALETGLPTVVLCLSSGLSGSYDGAMTALDRLREETGDEDLPIHVIDTRLATTAQNLLVTEAAHLRDGGATAEEIAGWAATAHRRIQTLCMMDGLDTLQRGGRMPKSVARIAGALDTKPFIAFDDNGGLRMVGVTHGRVKGKKKLAKFYADRHSQPVVVIGDADCPEDAECLEDLILKAVPDAIVRHCSVGPTIGSHVGPNTLVCSFWGAKQ